MAIRSIAVLLTCVLGPLPAAALCVSNGTESVLFFTIEAAKTGPRSGEWLGAAFASPPRIEGCSPLAEGSDRLQTFARFDRCAWASHPTESPKADD
jgi:hypothetical protein